MASSAALPSKRNLKLIKTLWGIDDPVSPNLFQSIRREGYHGVEVIRLAWTLDRPNLIRCLNESGLTVVCHIHTGGGFLLNGEYIYCGSYDVSKHKEDFKKQLKECEQLLAEVEKGGFVNVHAGVDAWSTDEAKEFLVFCLQEIKNVSFTVTFETHRQRLFGSPFQTRELLQLGDIATTLKLNADFSHWYCACERVFDSNQERDAKWWPSLLDLVAERCLYIHARFGWSQGPQMADPSAAECDAERTLQMNTWNVLLQKQIGDCFVSPEFGPTPYMPVIPHSIEPVASLSDAVAYTKTQIEELFVKF